MKQIGRKVYYDKATGNVLLITSEMVGDVKETTTEQDFEIYEALKGRVPDTVGVIQLQYGELADSFARMTSVRVENGELIFTYQDPTQPTGETTPSPSLESRISAVEDAINSLLGL